MSLYTTTLPSYPNWQVKVRTMQRNGRYVATTSLPMANGTVVLNKEHESEHTALHRVIDTMEELLNRIQYPYLEQLN